MLMLMSLVLCLSHKCEPGFRYSYAYAYAYVAAVLTSAQASYAYVYAYACVASEDRAFLAIAPNQKSLLYGSPESLTRDEKFREMFSMEFYQKILYLHVSHTARS